MADPAELRDLAEEAARAAGELLLDGLDRVRTDVQTKSTSTDMVSEMDRAAEALLLGHLLGARPDDGMTGEEGTDRPGSTGVRWIVDPLDGTTNYLYGLPGFGVSIAAALEGVVVAGVVLDVLRDELFSATLGGGARCGDRPIRVSEAASLATALVATGFSYDPAVRREQAVVLNHVLPRVRDIRRFGAAAVDLCSVACGRVDAYFERGLAEWDLAAGGLIAREAGAVLTDLQGGPVTPGSVLAAAPGLAGELVTLLQAAQRPKRDDL